LFSLILFFRSKKKFQREISKEKSYKKFSENLDDINQHEYKLTSQNNEDGIIEYIFTKIPSNNYFVEIGFDLFEFNSLNLIQKGWKGELIEYNSDECLVLKVLLKRFFSNSSIKVLNEKIIKENVNSIIFGDNKNKKIDFFSIDIDGNDYWVLKELDLENINVVCCEYNHWIAKNEKKTIRYNPEHIYENDGYFGASLIAISDLMNTKGFDLVAVESSGTNAFFVKKEFSNNFEILSPIKSWKSVGRHEKETQVKMIKNNMKKLKFEDV
jgi:hypothetical protein